MSVHASIDHPQAPGSYSVIGCDGANGTFSMLYTDDRNVCRIMGMSLNEGVWKLWRDGAPFSQRFVGMFIPDGNTITGYWEMAEDRSHYHKDFDLVYRRVVPR